MPKTTTPKPIKKKTTTKVSKPTPSPTIAEIAYGIWEAEGYQHGQDVEHWLRAEIIFSAKA